MVEWDRVELTAESAEPIVAIPVREGDRVQAGQILVKLDSSRHLERLKQARAVRDEAAARLQELQKGPRHERIKEAEAKYQGAFGFPADDAGDAGQEQCANVVRRFRDSDG
jgi:HlyD family secretion protein